MRREDFLDRLFSCISRNIPNEEYSMDEMARDMCMSRSSLFRMVKECTGTSPARLLREARRGEGTIS